MIILDNVIFVSYSAFFLAIFHFYKQTLCVLSE